MILFSILGIAFVLAFLAALVLVAKMLHNDHVRFEKERDQRSEAYLQYTKRGGILPDKIINP